MSLRRPSLIFGSLAFVAGCFLGELVSLRAAGQEEASLITTSEGRWQSDGESLLLEAEPGESFLVLHTVWDPEAEEVSFHIAADWVEGGAEGLKLSLAETGDILVARVTASARWNGEFFAPCQPPLPVNCPYPPKPPRPPDGFTQSP